jgi:hypothetical protein
VMLLPFSDFHRSLRVLEDRRHVPGPQMQGALASPNLVTFQRTKISPDRNFSGGTGQGRAAASSTGGRGTKEPRRKGHARFSPSSTNRRCRIEEGASPSSPSVRSRTAGSETFRSRGGGLDAMHRRFGRTTTCELQVPSPMDR